MCDGYVRFSMADGRAMARPYSANEYGYSSKWKSCAMIMCGCPRRMGAPWRAPTVRMITYGYTSKW